MNNLARVLASRIREQRRCIIVIGDVMIDRWVHGHLAPCQDGCDKFVEEGVVEVPGGAANAARSIEHWGAYVLTYGHSRVDRPIKCRYVDESKRIVFRADGNECRTARKHNQWGHPSVGEVVERADGVLLSDYDKGFLTPEFISGVASACREKGIPCVADCKREPATYAGCILKCNSDYQHQHNNDLFTIVNGISGRLVATFGSTNPLVWDYGEVTGLGKDWPVVKCVNHVGAGDCFAAHLTLALAYMFSLKDATAIAHSAGRVYVQCPHNRPPTPDEVEADLDLATAG